MTLNDFLKDMVRPNSMWDQIINNIIGSDKALKRALISEISLSFLERRDKIQPLLQRPDFKYYFVKTILNQVKSKSSPLYKNYKMTIANSNEFDFQSLEIESTNQIEEKIELEEKIKWIEDIIQNIKIGWFGSEMFRLYYKEGMTYREIEKEYGINFLTAFNEVKKVKQKIDKYKNGGNHNWN
jgi:RNA polymerase sigma factor (sigma-70 family)